MPSPRKPSAPHRKPAAPATPTRPIVPANPTAGVVSGRAAERPLTDWEIDELQTLLDRVPAPLEPLDVSMLDGFLCGVLVQPQPVPADRWLARVLDVEGRALPAGFDARRIEALVERRHAELEQAIARRQWFDPWVFELTDDAEAADRDDADVPQTDDAADAQDAMPPEADAVYPWVAGFATALELFPALLRTPADVLTEPLALLYRHLAPDDLEDADELLAEIDSLEPPADLGEAVEELVRATLLLADIGRPLSAPVKRPGAPRRSTRRGG